MACSLGASHSPAMRFGFVFLLLLPGLTGCGAARNTDDPNQTLTDSSVVEDGFTPILDSGPGLEADLDGGGKECKNLQCKQVTCAGGKTTALTGTVFNPGKSDPLYNVVVFVPNVKPEPFKPGVSCEKCGIVS